MAAIFWGGLRHRPNLTVAAALFTGALVAFMALDVACGIDFTRPSTNPYYVYQASSWLQGRWDLTVPGDKTDLIILNGKLYSIFAPFPVALLLPFVALWGNQASDILFTLVVLLLYYSAGYQQFGTRYLFDFYPYVWILLALSPARLSWRVVALGVFGVVVNILGAHQFWTHVMLRL